MQTFTPLGAQVSTNATPVKESTQLQRIPPVGNPLPTLLSLGPLPENFNPATPPKLNTAPPTLQTTLVGNSGPPPLTKVTKGPSVTSKPISKASSPHVHPAELRPSWPPVAGYDKAPHEISQTVATPIVKPTTVLAPVLERVVNATEDYTSLYLITCSMGKPVEGEIKGMDEINMVHGIYTYAEAMQLRGKDLAEKLCTLVTSNLSDWAPPFIKLGIGVGTIEVNVMYPIAGGDKNLVAKVVVQNSEHKEWVYRTYFISKVRPNTVMEYKV